MTSGSARRPPVQTTDRDEFEQLVAELCAGYEKPVTKHRTDAYWAGLKRMSIAQFRRCVEFAISELGPEELPGSKGIWKILRGFRQHAPGPKAEREDARDHLEHWANRLLFSHLRGRGGLGSVATFIPGESASLKDARASAELEACLKLKRELVDWFLGPVRDGDPDTTPAEFLRQWIAGLQAISRIDKSTYDRWCKQIEEPAYSQPFEPYMARELKQAAAA
jgi:hypothetical protein